MPGAKKILLSGQDDEQAKSSDSVTMAAEVFEIAISRGGQVSWCLRNLLVILIQIVTFGGLEFKPSVLVVVRERKQGRVVVSTRTSDPAPLFQSMEADLVRLSPREFIVTWAGGRQ